MNHDLFFTKERVELHLHTKMSKLDATIDAASAVRRAAGWGHCAVAITDHGCVYAFPEAERAALRSGVKVIYGMEGYLQSEDEAYRYHHIILLACSRTGLKNLYKLVSLSHLRHYDHVPLIPREALTAHREGLLIGSACAAGELFRAVVSGRPWDELRRIASFYDYLEIQPLCNNAFLLRDGTARSEEQLREWNRTIIRLGEELGIPVCATGDVHFLDPEDEPGRHALLCARQCDDFDAPLPLYFRSTEEMLAEFAYLGADKAYEVVVTNTRAIADRVETFPLLPEEGSYRSDIPGGEARLRQAVETRCRDLYGETPPREIVERLAAEWNIILPRGYAGFFETARRLVLRSRENGYPVGFRGSLGASLTAFLAGITDVNPLPPHYRCPICKQTEFDVSGSYGCGADLPDKRCPGCGSQMAKDGFDIPMETLFSLGGGRMPAISLNFAQEYHHAACRHLTELFGEKHVFWAGVIPTLENMTAKGLVVEYARKSGLELDSMELDRLSALCQGVRRSMGLNPGGLVIVPAEMEAEDFTPIQSIENDGALFPTTHLARWDLGWLYMIELIGTCALSMLALLERSTGIDPETIPLDDPEALSHLKHTDPDIPVYNGKYIERILSAAEPASFDDLRRTLGLAHSTGAFEGNAEELLKSGVALRDIVTTRDDILLYLVRMGLSRRRANQIMEAVRKGEVWQRRVSEWPHWMEELRAHSVPEWYIGALEKISYLCPKARAVGDMEIIFRLAWFKMHYPEAFLAANQAAE